VFIYKCGYQHITNPMQQFPSAKSFANNMLKDLRDTCNALPASASQLDPTTAKLLLVPDVT